MQAPLAERLRPKTLDEMVGQRHLLGGGCVLRNIIAGGEIPNMVFYGPSGVGKTTLASIIANQTNRRLHKLNGTNASTADIKQVVGELDTLMAQRGILLYLDEIQYFNKKQQQSLLEYIENGRITLIASTTENPYFYIYNAILSRATVFEFKPISAGEILPAVRRAVAFLEAERNIKIELENGVAEHICAACGGDVRKALTAVELCVLSSAGSGVTLVTLEQARQVSQKSAMRYDRDGDEHYDCLSAFQKSMRGSDANAALHYLARLLEAGDLPSICRRLMVCACEDVGLAFPNIIPIVKACVDAAFQVGLPEARMPLSDAVVLVCRSPKSNSAPEALSRAESDIKSGISGDIPAHLKDSHYAGAAKMGRGLTYKYPHGFENNYVAQQYLPDELRDAVYYIPGGNKNEQAAQQYWEKVMGGK